MDLGVVSVKALEPEKALGKMASDGGGIGDEQDVIDMDDAEESDDIVFLGYEEELGAGIEEILQEKRKHKVHEDNNSEDESYVATSDWSDIEESVDDDFEVGGLAEENGSDHDDEDLGPQYDSEPPKQITVVSQCRDGSCSNPFFQLGMTFLDKGELKRALDRYAIKLGVNLRILRSDKRSVRVVCEEGCPFVLYASKDGSNVGLKIKTLYYEHSCARVYKNQRASVMWLAEHFKQKVQEMPQFKISEMQKEVASDLKVHVSLHKCKRAKRKIMQELEGSYIDEFAKLEAYCNELRISNPGSDVSVQISDEALEQGRRVFRRMYLCFNASKIGWKQGCRPLIGVDGTFLKGKARGILLTAVGIDANDSLYPLAFGLTQKENFMQWTWFLQCIRSSLDLGEGETITMISDMQKGLCQAVSEVFPHAEHRFCARHIYANWSKTFRGNEMKKKFFSCAWSSFKEQFKDNITALGALSSEAARIAMTYNPKAWVRAYFSSRSKSWMVDNNISESLNAWIDEYRYLPVIRMFDGIRVKMMGKWAESENNARNWKSEYSPKCIEMFEVNRYLATSCRVFFNGDQGYEVIEGPDRHSVWLNRNMCTCRAWDLTGIPCQHAIVAMYHTKIDPKTQISHYFHKETYLASYRAKLQPVRGKQFWDTENFSPMQPPPIESLPGRPPKKRVRTEEAQRRRNKYVSVQNEERTLVVKPAGHPSQAEKLSKKGKSNKCSVCHKEGHNKSTCKEVASSSTPRQRHSQPSQPSSQPFQATPPPSQPSQQPPPPSQPSQQSQRHSQPSQQPRRHSQPSQQINSARKKCVYKPRTPCGMGISYDEVTGTTVYNPGLSSEVVIEEGTAQEYMHQYSDPQIKFPIPKESEFRKSMGASLSAAEGSRKIQFTGEGNNVPPPTDLPFTPPGLQWRGQPCVTTSQLLAKRHRMNTRISNNTKNI